MRSPARPAPFIVVEGIDGAGKTTQAKLLEQALMAFGTLVHLTREPSDGPVGTLIRKILAGYDAMHEQALTLLYAADRLDHVTGPDNGIVATLAKGITVISDRYCLSSFAYHAHGASRSWIEAINAPSLQAAVPDLTLFLEVSPEVALERLRRRGGLRERYEHDEVLREVHDAYHAVLTRHAARHHVVRISGEASVQVVHAAIMKHAAPLVTAAG